MSSTFSIRVPDEQAEEIEQLRQLMSEKTGEDMTKADAAALYFERRGEERIKEQFSGSDNGSPPDSNQNGGGKKVPDRRSPLSVIKSGEMPLTREQAEASERYMRSKQMIERDDEVFKRMLEERDSALTEKKRAELEAAKKDWEMQQQRPLERKLYQTQMEAQKAKEQLRRGNIDGDTAKLLLKILDRIEKNPSDRLQTSIDELRTAADAIESLQDRFGSPNQQDNDRNISVNITDQSIQTIMNGVSPFLQALASRIRATVGLDPNQPPSLPGGAPQQQQQMQQSIPPQTPSNPPSTLSETDLDELLEG